MEKEYLHELYYGDPLWVKYTADELCKAIYIGKGMAMTSRRVPLNLKERFWCFRPTFWYRFNNITVPE